MTVLTTISSRIGTLSKWWRDVPLLPTIRLPRIRWSLLLPLLIALLVLLPIASLVIEILTPDVELWQQMLDTFLPRVVLNTLMLVAGVGIGTFIIGTSFAWLVTAYDFPGRRFFDHMLLLPLAIPTFVMGFTFLAIFEFAGPVQTQLREWFGRDVWFPDVHSTGGVILVLTLVLYPYVYILARAAFREQTASTFEAAQMMGYNRLQTFFKLVLPLARPSLVAGTILAMMEALTDFGAVKFFSVPTLSERIVIIWEGRFDRAAATELASLLLLFALAMILLERALRGKAKFYQQGGASKGRRPKRAQMRGWHRWTATAACTGLIGFAFALPVFQLVIWGLGELHDSSFGSWQNIYGDYIANSVTLAGTAAGVVILLALVMAHGVRGGSGRGEGRRLPRFLARMVTLGYAMPGAVIAAGVLFFISPVDGAVTRFAENVFGYDNPAYLLTGTMVALTYAYLVRFMAVGYNSVESSLDKITPNMEQAARTMGAGPLRVLRRIHLPLVSTGMAAGAILIFVDVMKELPATLMLRPFGMDTLALWSYFLANEGFWEAAAIPALTILVVGLIPVFILMRVGDQHGRTHH